MKLNRYIKISALALAVAMTACGVEEPVRIAPVEQEKVSSLTEGAVAGELLVRFDAEVSDILDKAGVTKSGPAAPASLSGILSVD